MNQQQIISHIEDLGLSNKEAKVYIALLMLGPSAVQRIADQAGIKRVTAYVILESLIGLGLVSQSIKGKKTYFIAEDPNNLRRLIEKRENELRDQKQSFDQILPELQVLKTFPSDSPSVKFYDTHDGIKTIMNTFLEEGRKLQGECVYGFSNLDQFHSYFPEFKSMLVNPVRVKAGLTSKVLYTSSRGSILKATDNEKNRESRHVSFERFPMMGDVTIVGNNILMVSLSGTRPIGVTITSQELAEGLKAMHKLAWEAAGNGDSPSK